MNKNTTQNETVMVPVARMQEGSVMFADGIKRLPLYHGIDYIPEDEVTPAHMQVPPDCDLVIGCYYLDGGVFHPTPEFIISNMKLKRLGA